MFEKTEMQRNESGQPVSQAPQKSLLQIIEDTRETLPLSFAKFKDVEVIRTKLDAGDYSIVGFQNKISFERKSVGDAVSTLIGGHQRFLRELERMKSYEERYILIEHSPTVLYNYCATHGWQHKFDIVIQSLLAYAHHYNCRVRFCKNRDDMAAYIVRKCKEFVEKQNDTAMPSVPPTHNTNANGS